MKFKVLLRKGDDNDATHEYINILKDAAAKAFETTGIDSIYSVKKADDDDVLIIISPQAIIANKLYLSGKRKFIYWFQGVVPEEIVYLFGGFYTRIKAFTFRFAEKYILKNAEQIFFVSEKLHQHYKTKYGYNKDNYIVMPCFNQPLDESAFNDAKYKKPTFVYAGSMAQWQCPEETIRLFSAIKKQIPEATLTILTADQEKARNLLSGNNTEAEVKYVPLKELPAEMAKYKYGFLLRENMIINEVATPTKMNSYMASGVIPVFSDVIGDFKDVFRPLNFKVACDNSYDKIVEQIIKIENNNIDCQQILNEYRSIFNTYYNRDAYVSLIAEKLSHCFAKQKQ